MGKKGDSDDAREASWVERRSSSKESSPERSRKRKHKEKKHKKEKKQKKDKKDRDEVSKASPDRNSDLSQTPMLKDPQSIPVAIPESIPSTSREEWMGGSESGFLFPSVSLNEIRSRAQEAKAAVRAAKDEEVAKVYRARELNPYLKATFSDSDKTGDAGASKNDRTSSAVVGDGGASWLRRSYRRLREQAEERKCSLEEVAAERWGSLEKLLSMLQEAEEKESGSRKFGTTGKIRSAESDRGESYARRERVRTPERRKNYNVPRPDDDYRRNKPDRSPERRSRDSEESSRRLSRSEKPAFTEPSKKFGFVKPGEEISTDWRNRDSRSRRPVETPRNDASLAPPSSVDTDEGITKPSPKTASETVSTEEYSLSEVELNQLNAKLLRAEMMGDAATVDKLKAKLAGASKSTESAAPSRGKETVVLSRSHAKGFAYPVKSGPEAPANVKRAKAATHNTAGERERYFADDDKYSLQDLVSMERMQSAEDQNAMFARLAGKTKEKTDDDYGIDDAFMKTALKKESLDQMSLRDRDKAIMEHKQMGSALATCFYCLDGEKIPKHLVISVGKKVMLMLPPYVTLAEGHCLLCPLQHTPCGTMLDEDVWEEMLTFRRALCSMYDKNDMDCVFMETAMNLKSHPHMRLECIPMEKEVGSMSPMYFKKAILEAEGWWTQNVKLVDLSKKDVRRAIPKALPYFAVDFGMQGGYAHVIEDEQRFPAYFGREIVGGMIDAEPRLWLKNLPQDFNQQMKNVAKFTAMWEPFDCTEKSSKT